MESQLPEEVSFAVMDAVLDGTIVVTKGITLVSAGDYVQEIDKWLSQQQRFWNCVTKCKYLDAMQGSLTRLFTEDVTKLKTWNLMSLYSLVTIMTK